jgi:hypothetical protein
MTESTEQKRGWFFPTMRMPQVGERWRYVPKPSEEFKCQSCKFVFASNQSNYYGLEVEILPQPSVNPCCPKCRTDVSRDGMIRIKAVGSRIVGNSPYTWLEPVESFIYP